LHRLYPGVYAVGHTALSRDAHWLAAVLACGAASALSHRDAAALLGLRPDSRPKIDVTTPHRSGRRGPRSVDLHRTRRLAAHEVTVRRGIPVTTVNRTIIDLADRFGDDAVERLLNEAEVTGQLDLSSLVAAVEEATGRCGAARLGRLILRLTPAPPTRTKLERLFVDLCRDHGIPAPVVNATVDPGFEVDFLWPQNRLIVETDGGAVHRARRAFENDRRRDADLTVAGYRVVRFTWRRVTETPDDVALIMKQLLARGVT